MYLHVFPQISVVEVATEESGAIEGAAAEAGTGEVAMGAKWEEGKRSLAPCLAVGLIGTVRKALFMCKYNCHENTGYRQEHPERTTQSEFPECFWMTLFINTEQHTDVIVEIFD